MARQAYANPDLAAAAAPELRALRDLTGETSYLAALDGPDVISLERYDGAHSQRSSAALGQRKPAYCTSQGKAILSALDATTRDALVRDMVLKPLTALTITDRRRLQAELKITAARGYAIDDEEIVLGVRCVGAPVVDPTGKVRGAISVAGPAWRLTRERVELLGPELADAARRIGAQLPALTAAAPAADDAVLQPVVGSWAFFGAHPVWCGRRQTLFWADTLAPSLRAFDGRADEQLASLDAPVVGVVMQGDELLVAFADNLVRVNMKGHHTPVTPWPAGVMQAICAGDAGAVWVAFEVEGGGAAIGLVPAASSISTQTSGHFKPQWRMTEPVQCLHWSAQDNTLYAAAPASGTILMMQPGTAAVRRLATVPKGSGRISGLARDAAGGLWTALRDGWSVVRISPEGNLDRVMGLPVPCPTDVAIGGPDMDQLFVTTARQPVSLDALANAPGSGRLFALGLNTPP
jgi:IclR family acetate operon transcriptional repressor